MTMETMDIIMDLMHIAALIYLIVRSGRRIGPERQALASAFFFFAVVSLLLSDLYWITFDLLYPNTRLPLAVNEISELAAFLLLSSALNKTLREPFGDARRELICAGFFALAGIALWIAWTGEWLQDIVGGIAYAWFVLCSVRAAKLTGAMSRKEWCVLGISSLLLVLGETAVFFVPEPWAKALDDACYALMTLGTLFFLVLLVRERKRGARPDVLLSLSCTGMAWSVSSMYMSDEPYYFIFYLGSMVMLLFMGFSYRREVAA